MLREPLLSLVLPPAITAIITGLGLWFNEWMKERDEAHRRLQAINEETAHLGFLKSWLEAQQLVGDTSELGEVRDQIRQELTETRARLQGAFSSRADTGGGTTLRRAAERAALVGLERPAARAARWVFWLALVPTVLAMGVAFATPADPTTGYGYPILLRFTVSVVFALPFLALSIGFRAWALRIERHGGRVRKVHLPPPPGHRIGSSMTDGSMRTSYPYSLRTASSTDVQAVEGFVPAPPR